MFTSPPAPKRRTSFNSDTQVFPGNENGNSPQGSKWLLLFLLGITIAIGLILWNSNKRIAPGVIETPDGEIVLSPERQAKLGRELEEIDNATQYALVATIDGEYPCLSCPFGLKVIYLYKGNVWKYGVTRKGEAERYPGGNYGAPNLLFLPMFYGTYSECLKEEKRLIYNYPLLPEASARDVILSRPPGNNYDT